MRAMEGVFVCDLSGLLPGPLATLMLARMGAEVTRVEPPNGDAARRHGDAFEALHRGKSCITLDLKTEEGVTELLTLIRKSHVLVESFRPGVLKRLSPMLDPVELRKTCPTLVICSISGYGQQDPRAAHDVTVAASSGLLGAGGDHVVMPTAQFGDLIGGTYPAVIRILAAVMVVQRGGSGEWIDISMHDRAQDALLYTQGRDAAMRPERDPLLGRMPCYSLYSTRDNRQVAVAAIEPQLWSRLTVLLQLDPSLAATRFDTGPRGTPVRNALTSAFASKTAHEWRSLLHAHDCACAVVERPADVVPPRICPLGLPLTHKL